MKTSANRPTLKSLALRGSVWTVFGHGGGQIIRLLRSLVLTRLLFPEAFGVMSLVWVVMYGLEMFSDIGIGPAVIRDKRGDDTEFLNTAWTLQAARGAFLWGGACILALPMAAFYSEPELARLIPVAGLTALIAGFNSTALQTCRRRMEFGRLTLLEVSNEAVGLVVTVIWAILDPSVWALVGGALIGRLYYTLASHFLLPGIRNSIHWEPEAFHTIFGFGKWIFFSSMFQFLANQSDRMLLGRYLSMTELGIYSIAIMLSEAAHALILKVNYGVMFPAFGRVVQNEVVNLRAVYYRARLGIDAALILPIAVLMMLGDRVVGVLYDPRYHAAGWMLQILCVRLLMAAALTNSEVCLVALGYPQYAFAQNVLRAAWILIGVPVGWFLHGLRGVVWAVSLYEIPVLIVLWIGLMRHKILLLVAELRSLAFVLLGVLIGLALRYLLPPSPL